MPVPPPVINAFLPASSQFIFAPPWRQLNKFLLFILTNLPEKEVRIPFHGREILYVIGEVVVETACQEITCTPGSSYYAMVPGYILRWQYRKNEEGLPLSEIEIVTDFKTRKEIEQIIQEREAVTRVEFR